MIVKLTKTFLKRSFAALFLACTGILSSFAQNDGSIPYKTQEFSELDGIPVLIKHLPDWENHRHSTTLAKNTDELRSALGPRPLLDLIEFAPGMEAVTAQYDAGKLLIVEYTSPQESFDADVKITAAIAETDDGKTFYRRIGNYNVVVFDAAGEAAATELIEQVKYEKQIQWLGNNPFRISAERAFVITTADVFLSTLMVIVGGAVASVLAGLVIGYFFFFYRDGKRSKFQTYTDAGGMTRLNLDGFTPDITPDRLLGD